MLLLAMELAAHGLLSPMPIVRPSLGEAEGPDWTHCLSIPMVISEWLKAVEERTFTAIYTMLEDAYSPTAKQDLYREWAALLVSIKARECSWSCTSTQLSAGTLRGN